MGDEQTRPSEDHIRRTRQLVAIMLPALREVARRNGYALAVHGSLERDIDIIAAPWRDGASDAESLIRGLLGACKSVLGYATGPGGWTEQEKFDPPVGSLPNPNRQPHGRLSWSIIVHGGLYFDVSVMPRADQKPPKDEEDRMTASQPPPRRVPEEKAFGHLEEDQLRCQLDVARAENAELRRALEEIAGPEAESLCLDPAICTTKTPCVLHVARAALRAADSGEKT